MGEDISSNRSLAPDAFETADTPREEGTPTASGRPLARLVASAAFGASLVLVPPTANVTWDEIPARGAAVHSNVAGADFAFERPPLEHLAHTAVERMTPKRRALYEEITRIRDGFGRPVDVNRLLREMRENA